MLTERFELRVPKELLTRIDEWRRAQPDLPSRAEAIRRLMKAGMDMSRDSDNSPPPPKG